MASGHFATTPLVGCFADDEEFTSPSSWLKDNHVYGKEDNNLLVAMMF